MAVLEHLIPNDWETVRRNFERLERLFSLISKDGDGFGVTVAGLGVRFGVQTFTFAASRASGQVDISHGLGRTPAVAIVGGGYVSGARTVTGHVEEGTAGAATFRAFALSDTSFTGTMMLGWVVIG